MLKIAFISVSALVVCALLFSCSMTHRLTTQSATAAISLPQGSVSQTPEVKDVEQAVEALRKIAIQGRDSAYLVETEKDADGEIAIIGETIRTVYVVARSKNVVERNGEISIDFIVTIPEQLQSSNWGLELTPIIENNGAEEALQPLSIRGEFFSEVQKRQYWQMNKYLNRVLEDSTSLCTTTSLVAKYYEAYNGYKGAGEDRRALNLEKTYKETISFPYLTDSRLDSVLIRKGNIQYYYTQKYRPTKNTRKLNLFFRGKVDAVDRSSYQFSNTDTLSFRVTSMLSLLDNAPRYMIQVIDKYVQVKDRNFLQYLVGRTDIIDTLGQNHVQLQKIEHLMDTLINQYQFFVDSVVITASSSPEGPAGINNRLASGRAAAIKQHLLRKFGQQADTLIKTRSAGEDWGLLKRLIRHNSDIAHWAEITALIDESRDLDATEQQLRGKYPQDYAYLREVIYPQLRAVDFKYNLRRVDMVKDTIQLTVLDTAYMRGVQQLRDRDYVGALRTLSDYKCHNQAIALMSLGYDAPALEILQGLPAQECSAQSDYLTAIVLSRLNKPREGLEYFLKAVTAEPSLKFRGNLDPEIQILYKQNNVKSSF